MGNTTKKTRRCDYCSTGTFTEQAEILVEGERFLAHCCNDPHCRADAEVDIRIGLQEDACHFEAFGY